MTSPRSVRLWLLRHAEAEISSSSGHDADRRLTEAGKKRSLAVARAIARLEPGFDAVLVSPFLRARQTADPVLAACFRGEPHVTRSLVPSADPEEILREVGGLEASTVLLVGHQPHLGLLAGRLLLGRPGLEAPLKKATVVLFEAVLDPTGADPLPAPAELRLFLPARAAERLGG